MGQSQQEAIIQWDKVSRKLCKQCCKGNIGYLKCVTDLSAQWLCDWQPAKFVPAFRWETKFLPHTTGPQGKSQTCLTPNNEEQSASCIMPLTLADEPARQCYWFVWFVSFLSTIWWYLAFFFLIHKLCLLSFGLWHFLPYHTHSLILKKVTKDSFALCLWRFSIMESVKEVPDKLNITDIQKLKTGTCWEDFKKNRCRQEDWRGPVK